MRKYWISAITTLVVASLACNFGGTLNGSGTPQPDNVLFQDDFSNSFSGWDSVTDKDGITDYKDNSYQIQVNTIGSQGHGMDMWANPGKSFDQDVRVEADVTKISGPDNNDMGVLCRYTRSGDSYNFYYFLISSDGYVGIAKMENSESKMLSGDNLVPSDAVKIGKVNHIRGDCIGSKLTLYVNETQVATVTDTSFTSGDVGLIAGTFDTPGTDVQFDNFMVRKP